MIKKLGSGFQYLKSVLSTENLNTATKIWDEFENISNKFISNIDSANQFIKDNTEPLCEVLEIDYLDPKTLKSAFEEFGNKNFESVAVLKGKYDDSKDKRVFFIQKLDKNDKPIKENEILCIYVNNIDPTIQQWFGNKEMIKITK